MFESFYPGQAAMIPDYWMNLARLQCGRPVGPGIEQLWGQRRVTGERVLSWSPGKYQRRQIEGKKHEFAEASDVAQSKKRGGRTVSYIYSLTGMSKLRELPREVLLHHHVRKVVCGEI